MLHYPHINPVALHLGQIKIYWYGIMYLVSFALAWYLSNYRANHLLPSPVKNNQVSDLIFYSALGTISGGRCGYVLFYNFKYFLAHPQFLFKIWEGGMSFHGGLIGVTIALFFFAKKIKQPFWSVGDFIAPIAPIGIALGRIGNFINAELPGRVTTVFWGMLFPNAGPLPRHPSQLYEAFFEGLVLFVVLWIYARKARPSGAVAAAFLISYGVLRTGAEFFREPDQILGFIAWGWLTMGQLLSLIMIGFGIALIINAYSRNSRSNSDKLV